VQEKRTLSAGVMVVRRDGDSWKFLLLRAYGYWDFPKGIVRPGEAPVGGALREVEEETGLDALDFRWGHDYRETAPYNRGKVARYYLAETECRDIVLPVNPDLGKPEHDAFRWVSYEEALSMVASRVKPALEWARKTITGGQ